MTIDGELTYANANARWHVLAREALSAAEINCAGITKIDSAGLALLTALRSYSDRGHSGGADVRRLIHATPEIKRLAAAYDVAALFE